jgi:hypothetical protein
MSSIDGALPLGEPQEWMTLVIHLRLHPVDSYWVKQHQTRTHIIWRNGRTPSSLDGFMENPNIEWITRGTPMT